MPQVRERSNAGCPVLRALCSVGFHGPIPVEIEILRAHGAVWADILSVALDFDISSYSGPDIAEAESDSYPQESDIPIQMP